MCATPRPGTADRQGTVTDQNNWLRSWTNEYYLWYREVIDRDPAQFVTADYFPLLKTSANTPSGQPKDKFHFVYDTAVWQALSQGGVEAGYGAEFAILPPQNASGNWVKVVQRLPVRIRLLSQPGEPPLRAGVTATVAIDTGRQRSVADVFNYVANLFRGSAKVADAS